MLLVRQHKQHLHRVFPGAYGKRAEKEQEDYIVGYYASVISNRCTSYWKLCL